ncbi:MAG: Rv1355c family protein [Blastocatellia bacterium]|nr:Rv1355c family protein [Blastocatellia bacterium]
MSRYWQALLAQHREEDTTVSWRPQFFRLTEVKDQQSLPALLQADPGIQVFDSLPTQLRDLLRTRHPSYKLSAQELEAMTREYLRGWKPEEYGVWVYYPWSKRLVHLLDEAEFVELRTNRNHYKITPEEQAALANKRIGVVGLSVGQSVAVTMALERSFGELRLADFDTLDLSNLNRLRAGVHHLTVPKVYVTAREIAEIDPFLKVTCFPAGVTEENYGEFLLAGGKLDVLVEECDSLDVKVQLRYEARRHGIPVVMDTSDRGLLDVERFDLEPDRPIFRGLVGDLNPERLRGLTTEEKVPYVLQIIGADTMSTRLRASLIEVEQTISTWPQLASSVAHGGAAAADVVRRICLGQMRSSGRYFADLESLIADEPKKDAPPQITSAKPQEITVEQMRALACAGNESTANVYTSFAPDDELIRRLIGDAILAPSGGNSQPWQWLWDGRELHLFLDRSRSSLLDFGYGGSMVGLGAATENLLLSAHAAGLSVRLTAFPVEANEEYVARFRFLPAPDQSSEMRWRDDLYKSLALRCTNRQLNTRQALSSEALASLTEAVHSIPGAAVQWLQQDDELEEVGQLLGAGDRLRMMEEAFYQELMSELRWTPTEAQATRDGIELRTLALSSSDEAGVRISSNVAAMALVRQWHGGRNLEKIARKAIAATSAVGLITMPTSVQRSYWQGGRAVERCWLTATGMNLAFHPMTALPYMFARLLRGDETAFSPETQQELYDLRARCLRLFNVNTDDAEVMLFRVSVANDVSVKSLRRQIGDVLTLIC